MKSAKATKNNLTESTTVGRFTCAFKLNVKCFFKAKVCAFQNHSKPLISGHLWDPPTGVSVLLIDSARLIEVCKNCAMFVND